MCFPVCRYIPGRIYHIHSYPCDATKTYVNRLGALSAQDRLALEIRKKQERSGKYLTEIVGHTALCSNCVGQFQYISLVTIVSGIFESTGKNCSNCGRVFGFFEIRESCRICKLPVCHQCHSGELRIPLAHWYVQWLAICCIRLAVRKCVLDAGMVACANSPFVLDALVACTSIYFAFSLAQRKPTKSCMKCEAHYLAKMHVAKRGSIVFFRPHVSMCFVLEFSRIFYLALLVCGTR